MSAEVLYCKEVSQKIKDSVRQEVSEIWRKEERKPVLVTILVGENPASKVYVGSKIRAAEYTGIDGHLIKLPANVTKEELFKEIDNAANDNSVNGILVQLPLPPNIPAEDVIEYIPYQKDVDGFHPFNLGQLLRGTAFLESCTPAGIIEILRYFKISTGGKNVVIIGRSNIVGKPLANMLLQKGKFANATVTVVHTATKDISFYTKNADIIVVSAGRPGVLTADMVSAKAVVIDVGVNKISDRSPKGYHLVGDADFEMLSRKVRAITPVPGGVGLMTVAMLMRNVLKAFKYQNEIKRHGQR